MEEQKRVDPSAGSIAETGEPGQPDDAVEDIELPPDGSEKVLGGQAAPCSATDVFTQI